MSNFDNKQISLADQKRYRKLIKENRIEDAIEDYFEKYVLGNINEYNTAMSEFMKEARSGLMTAPERNSMLNEISVISAALATLMKNQYAKFVEVQGSVVLSGIKSKRVRAEIMKSATVEFERLINGAMSQTRENVLFNVRTIQRGFVTEAARLKGLGLSIPDIQKKIDLFKRNIAKQFPGYLELERNKNFLKSRIGKDGRVRLFKLENYSDMAIQTTLLNVDRTATEVEATIVNDIVVEYFLEDRRRVKTEKRIICQKILGKKINGKSLLALTEHVASKLGIMTVAKAKTTSDFAMGPWCRHNIRRVSKQFTKQLIKDFELEAA